MNLLNKERTSMSKAMLKTMAAIAAMAALVLMGATRIAMAQGAPPAAPAPAMEEPGADNKHGFTIPAYNITEVVTRDEPKTVSFVADKAGVFPFSCQLHPAHIG